MAKTLKIADQLLSDEGELDEALLEKMVRELKRVPKSDEVEHLYRGLKFFQGEGRAALKKFILPIHAPYVERLVLDTLDLQNVAKATVKHLRMAVISAVLTPLRQDIGSCFATAPAIVIQRELPGQLLADLLELIDTSRLKRTLTVPLAHFKRKGGHLLLKAWEYTLASLCDYKIDFYKWNLYASLGLKHDEKGGLGPLIFQKVSDKLDETNEKIEKLQREYEGAYNRMRMSETLFKQATSESRARQIKAEASAHTSEFFSLEKMRDRAYSDSQKLAEFYKLISGAFSDAFSEYFQEVYDPDMFEAKGEIYNDSPAGFRLFYKHGRTDPSTWTPICDEEGYRAALIDFILIIRPRLQEKCDFETGKELIEEITGAIIAHVRSDLFIRTAYLRLGAMHKKTQRGSTDVKTPWSYVSGGTMQTLVRCYFSHESELKSETCYPESPQDLLIFIIDTMKGLPWKDRERARLMAGPTHSFVLRPDLPLFKEAWLDDGFTYTWVRDRLIIPGRQDPKAPRLIFADTNWLNYYFGFVVNPRTGELELWRLDCTGKKGRPMKEWKHFFRKETTEPWTFFLDPLDREENFPELMPYKV